MALKITFSEQISLQDVEQFVSTNFGGFGRVSRTDDQRTILLTEIYWPYDTATVMAQLAAFEKDGVLTWEKD